MYKFLLLTGIFVFSLISSVTAQSVEEITLEKAIEIAIENNFQYKRAQNELVRAENNEFSAKMDFLPSLNANFRTGQTIGRQFNQLTVSFEDQINTSAGGGVSGSIDIFAGFRNINNLRATRSQKESLEQSLQRAKEDILFNVATQFLSIVLDKELLQIAEENLASQQKTLEQVQAQVEVGSRPIADLYNQESVVAQNELALIQRKNTLNNDRLALIRTLQIDPLKKYSFIPPKIDQNVTVGAYDIELLVKSALNNRSDIRAQEASIKASQLNMNIAKGGYMPTVSFSFGINSNYTDRIFDRVTGEQVSFSDQFFNQNVNRSFSLNFQIPIFSQFNVHTNVQNAKINYKNAQLDLENVKLGVIQEVNQAFNDYYNFAQQLEGANKALKFAQKSFETQQERYRIGASTLIELTQANAQFVEASSNRIQALYRLIFQEQLIEYFTGKLNDPAMFE